MNQPPDYEPPQVWSWNNKASGGRFAHINRPVAGATHDKALPVGRHPLQLYSLGTPNGVKVTVMLEELLALGHSGAEYDAWLVRISEGEQFGSGFVAVNPNSKIPALLDRSGEQPVRVFESGAILLYLAEKFGAFVPAGAAARAECLSWLFWQMGSAPFLGGGFGHFYAYAPHKIEYAIDRYAMEVKRQLTCWTAISPTGLISPASLTASPTWPCGRGTARWSWGSFMRLVNFCRSRTIAMWCAGPSTLPRGGPCNVAAWSTARSASPATSCMSGTMPVTSTPAPRTS